MMLFSMMPIRRTGIGAVLAFLAAFSGCAFADAYPQRPVRLVVPFSAGGVTDVIARVIAGSLQARLGQPVIVDNRPGASTMIAAAHVAKARPDGYTLLLGSSTTFSMLPALRPHLSIAAEGIWAPVGLVAETPVMISSRTDSGIGSFQDLLARARARPGALTYGTTGVGTAPHLIGAIIAADFQVDITPVQYRGSTQVLADVVNGQIDLSFDPVGVVRPFIGAGMLRPLAISTAQRLPAYPAVPTFGEVGIGDLGGAFWFGLAAPSGTPRTTLQRLQEDLQAVLREPRVEEAFRRQSIIVLAGNAEEFRRRVHAELTRYRQLARDGSFTME
ncbi:tripartite tricarboxylate transporter substrate binding protein [Cupriavidus basilensis]|uniref:Tripartite tricarboxylate transporter substrate binding protein n=1 Tax=Cupriavidus basilensis TaxID=68895 RepID=A0ABT6AHZ0_9BURK|nr:tripartite tricarboxylate transporter substrate binding protein [Cupriavidus basilensis]MDF3832074.1 tripartite tricarboxylate transporter substrate binding protein [Cupriavidus basilensis]